MKSSSRSSMVMWSMRCSSKLAHMGKGEAQQACTRRERPDELTARASEREQTSSQLAHLGERACDEEAQWRMENFRYHRVSSVHLCGYRNKNYGEKEIETWKWRNVSTQGGTKRKRPTDDDMSVLNIKSHDFLATLLKMLRFLKGILFYIIAKITKRIHHLIL
jgi:hypothetical protein